MAPQFQAPPGTSDLMPPASRRFAALAARFASKVEAAGFGLIVGPLFEELAVYERVGGSTDIVRKEMYDFKDKGDRHLALRPDSTPSVVRAFVQHRPPTPWKVWYLSPHFRYDRPQRGRYRQHHSLGVEALGVADADLDVEVVALFWGFLVDLGLSGLALAINSIGDEACRPAYRAALLEHLQSRTLCPDHAARVSENPLRVLDCKRDACQEATSGAPVTTDHLCEPCSTHFRRVRDGLESLGISATVDSRLVRGQDYYTRTTFEITTAALESAQNALGGGGRYDGFVAAMGGPETPGIGFGCGVERILIALDLDESAGEQIDRDAPPLDVFVVDVTGGEQARTITHALREAGLRADRAFAGPDGESRSLKSQLKAADRSGARLAVLIGPDEVAAGVATVRNLREQSEQLKVPIDELTTHLRSRPAEALT